MSWAVLPRGVASAALAVLLGFTPQALLADEGDPAPGDAGSFGLAPGASIPDLAGVESWLDGLMAAHLPSHEIAGATVSIVQGGRLVLAKGYGFADVAARRPVDAERTLFRIGSISKIFTWTAVMQLVEEGRLDLKTDVNEYLDFEIPDTYPEPITLTHLLTHTPGFEDRLFGLFSQSADDIRPLGQWLPENLPARVRPPGLMSAYSNYGSALAGYIVERVSGQPLDDFIEERTLEPLGMSHTTTRQPLPASLAGDMSEGYTFEDGRFVPQFFEIVPGAAPAGAASSSAADMAIYMMAHLGLGSYRGARILAPETSRRMQETLFRHDPRVNGFAHGFYEMSSHGERIIGHGGDTLWFHSLMALFPERDLGVFVSYNSARGGELSLAPFLRAFLGRYFPMPPAAPAITGTTTADLARFAGSYRMNRMSYTTFEKVLGLFMVIDVAAMPEGELLASTPIGAYRMRQVEPLVFQQVGGDQKALLREDESGRITHLFINSVPMMAFVKPAWWQSSTLHQVLLGLGILVSLALALSGVVRLVCRFGRRDDRREAPRLRLARLLLTAAGVLNTLFAVTLAIGARDPIDMMTSNDLTGIVVLLSFPFLAAVLLIPIALFAGLAWRDSFWTLGGWLRYTVSAVILGLFAWSLWFWNLLGWHLG